jgi:parallel beta-helix repeat protein
LNAENFTNAGQVYLMQCEDSIVENVQVEYLENGILIEDGNNITIRNCIVKYPNYGGIFIRGCSDLLIFNNTILGWSYNWQKYDDLTIAVVGIEIYEGIGNSININITPNVVSGYKNGIIVFAYSHTYWIQKVFNLTVWDNYFADNEINGYAVSPDINNPYSDLKFDNSTLGNYWDDYDAPRIASGVPSASGTHTSAYRVNGIVDNNPLTEYDHPLFLPDLESLFPWAGLNIWVIIGIVAGAAGVASMVIVIIIKKRKAKSIN